MPLVTVLNLRSEDDLVAIETSVTKALAGMPELGINDSEIDVIRPYDVGTAGWVSV